MTTLAENLVPDTLWELVEPLLPSPPRPPYGGRHRTICDRACFAAIVYMGLFTVEGVVAGWMVAGASVPG
jgi:hypothetical protein